MALVVTEQIGLIQAVQTFTLLDDIEESLGLPEPEPRDQQVIQAATDLLIKELENPTNSEAKQQTELVCKLLVSSPIEVLEEAMRAPSSAFRD